MKVSRENIYRNDLIITFCPDEKDSAEKAYIWIGTHDKCHGYIDDVRHFKKLRDWCDKIIQARTKK